MNSDALALVEQECVQDLRIAQAEKPEVLRQKAIDHLPVTSVVAKGRS